MRGEGLDATDTRQRARIAIQETTDVIPCWEFDKKIKIRINSMNLISTERKKKEMVQICNVCIAALKKNYMDDDTTHGE